MEYIPYGGADLIRPKFSFLAPAICLYDPPRPLFFLDTMDYVRKHPYRIDKASFCPFGFFAKNKSRRESKSYLAISRL